MGTPQDHCLDLEALHHCLNGHEFEQTSRDSERQRSLACCRPWGRRVEHDLVTEHSFLRILTKKASLIAQLVKNTPAVWETWVRSLGWEDPLEKGKATHSSILAWRIP